MRAPTLVALAFVLAGIVALAGGSARSSPGAGGPGAAAVATRAPASSR